MKILDIPQSGKRGLNVSQAGQFGQISRALAIPSNPRTPAQMAVRNILRRVSASWRALSEAIWWNHPVFDLALRHAVFLSV